MNYRNRLYLRMITTALLLTLGLGLPIQAQTHRSTTRTAKLERYWPVKAAETSVEIDGYDFDFETPKRGRGYVDGPFSHNGHYRVLRNVPGALDLRVNIGTDAKQTNDLNVELRISRGRARVSGSVHGRKIRTLTAPVVRRNGQFELRFRVVDQKGKTSVHTIRWRAG